MRTGARLAALVGAVALASSISVGAQAPGPDCGVPGQITSRPDGWTTVRNPGFLRPPDQQAITGYAIHPLDPETLMVTNGVGVQLSLDGGCTWDPTWGMGVTPVPPRPGYATARIVALAISPSVDAPTLYIAISEGEVGAPGAAVPVVFRSRDMGATWELSSAGLVVGRPVELAVAPSQPDVAYLSVRTTTEDLVQSGLISGSDASLVYVTRDGGSTWLPAPSALPEQQSTTSPERPVRFVDLVVDPADPEELWATARQEAYHSEDGGRTWAQVLARPGYPLGSVDVSHPAGVPPIVTVYGSRHPVAARSIDGGETWEPATGPEEAVQSVAHGRHAADLVAASAFEGSDNPLVPADARNEVYRHGSGGWSSITPDNAAEPLSDVTADWHQQPSFFAWSPGSVWIYRPWLDTRGGAGGTGSDADGEDGGDIGTIVPPGDGFQGCALESPRQPPWDPSWVPLPEDSPLYVSNHYDSRLVAYGRYGRGHIVGIAPRFSEGIALDPLGRVIVSTRFTHTLTRITPWACLTEILDPFLPLAEGPDFDGEGNMYVNSTGPTTFPARVWRYPWPQFPGQQRERIWDFGTDAFIEDVKVAPEKSPYAGDLFVLLQDSEHPYFGVVRLSQQGGAWVRMPDVWSAPGPSDVTGMAFQEDGSLLLSEWGRRDPEDGQPGHLRILKLDPEGRPDGEFARIKVGVGWSLYKIDVSWDGLVYVVATRHEADGDSLNWLEPPSAGRVYRFDPQGRPLVPAFHQSLTYPLGVAVSHFPPPPPPPCDPCDEEPTDRGGGGTGDPPPLPPLANPGPVPNPLPAAGGATAPVSATGPAPVPLAQANAQAQGNAQAQANAQAQGQPLAAAAAQKQKQAQTALARSVETVADQDELAMSARSRRDPLEDARLPLAAGGALALGFGCLVLARRHQHAHARGR